MRRAKDISSREDPVLRKYLRLASRYDRRWSSYIEATVIETTRRLTLNPADRLLDIGCGTGAFLYALSRKSPTVRLTGIDASREMLAVASERVGSCAELKQGWAEQIPFADDSFDVVVSSSVFHYIRDPTAALAEILRVLRSGGRLVITDWCADYLACRVCDLFFKFFYRTHFQIYRLRECRELLDASGFTAIDVERYKINWLWGLMTARAQKPCRVGFALHK
jgi:ubiquinone/menaquinone biosynthesis C-methylase UbiE